MKIALIGYGKMGKTIEKIALERGHKIVSKLEESPNNKNLNSAEIAIEFSTPESAYNNIKKCFDLKIPVVSGTTGWISKLDYIKNYCLNQNGSFIYSSNFSLGVNIFFYINKKIAKIMKKHTNYKVKIEETHHNKKKDKPSGTALSLADTIIQEYKLDTWIINENSDSKKLGIFSKRDNATTGIHNIIYTSKEDLIKIEHLALNRDGFARGAIIASEFLINKKGIFTMQDVLDI